MVRDKNNSGNVFLLALMFFASSTEAVIIDRIAAVVNGEVITASEVEAMAKVNLNISGLPKNPDPLKARIEHHLAFHELSRFHPLVLEEEDIQRALEQYQAKYGTQEKLVEFLSSIGMDYIELTTEVHEQLTIRHAIEEKFRPFVNLTIDEAEEYYEKEYKPSLQILEREVPPFLEVFEEIQKLLLRSRIEDDVKKWLEEARAKAVINIKE